MPYRLFALSNFASLLGLLAYPLIVEPKLTLSQQSNGWSAAYIAFAAACIGTALFGRKARHNGLLRSDMTVRAMEEEPFPPETSEKTLWLLLATCSSVLLLATTNYLT
jgi:hypothetical protein